MREMRKTVCVCLQSVGGSLWNGWKTLAEKTKAGWKNCGCVERGQTVRTPALRSYYSQDTGAEKQHLPSLTHTPCETLEDCLYNQLMRTYYVYMFTIPGNCPENSLVICLSCPAHHLCERKHTCCTETLKTSKLSGTAHRRESQCL